MGTGFTEEGACRGSSSPRASRAAASAARAARLAAVGKFFFRSSRHLRSERSRPSAGVPHAWPARGQCHGHHGRACHFLSANPHGYPMKLMLEASAVTEASAPSCARSTLTGKRPTSPCPCTPSMHALLTRARPPCTQTQTCPAPDRRPPHARTCRPPRAPARTARARAALLRRPPPSQGQGSGSHLRGRAIRPAPDKA